MLWCMLVPPSLQVLESNPDPCASTDLKAHVSVNERAPGTGMCGSGLKRPCLDEVYIVGILKNVSNDTANQKHQSHVYMPNYVLLCGFRARFLAQRGAVTSLFKLMDPKVLTAGTSTRVQSLRSNAWQHCWQYSSIVLLTTSSCQIVLRGSAFSCKTQR